MEFTDDMKFTAISRMVRREVHQLCRSWEEKFPDNTAIHILAAQAAAEMMSLALLSMPGPLRSGARVHILRTVDGLVELGDERMDEIDRQMQAGQN